MASKKTRDRLLEATAELLGRHGYQGTGVNAVLAASGTPNGSLYHHFPEGKDQLVAAAIERIGERTSELLVLAFEREPAVALELIFDWLATRLERDGFGSGCRVATPLADGGADVVAVREAAARAFATPVRGSAPPRTGPTVDAGVDHRTRCCVDAARGQITGYRTATRVSRRFSTQLKDRRNAAQGAPR